jgi:hypothetical protein
VQSLRARGLRQPQCIRRHGLRNRAKDWPGRGLESSASATANNDVARPASLASARARSNCQFSGTRSAYQLFSRRNTLRSSALIPTDQRTSSWLQAIARSFIRQVPTGISAWKTCRFAERANYPCNLPGARRIRSSATAMSCSYSNAGHVAGRTTEARTPTTSRIMAAFC